MFQALLSRIFSIYAWFRRNLLKLFVGSGMFFLLVSIFTFVGFIREAKENFDFLKQVGASAQSMFSKPQTVFPNDAEAKRIEALQEEVGCSFKPSEWSLGSGELTVDDDNIYSMQPHVYSSTIRHQVSISSKSTVNFTFTPESQLINTLVLYHELMEVVVGDGDEYGVTLKANLGTEKMEMVGERFVLPGGIRIGNDVATEIQLRPLSRGDFHVVVTINYLTKKGGEATATFARTFPIPSDLKNSEKPLYLSVGFVNTQDEDNGQMTVANFKCFKISEAEEETGISQSTGRSKEL